MKETYYFPHDYNSVNDPKIQSLISEYGAFGYGIYWYIIELMHQEESHKLPMKQYVYQAIAKQMQASAKQILANLEQIENVVKHCILVSELFVVDGDFFYSVRVMRNFDERAKLSEKRSVSGKLGAIAKQNLASAQQILAKSSKGKEKKGKENINITIPDYLQSSWNAYLEMRNRIKKPMTDKAQDLGLKKLYELSSDQDIQIKIVEQSTFNSYQGLFPLKDTHQQQSLNFGNGQQKTTDSGRYRTI